LRPEFLGNEVYHKSVSFPLHIREINMSLDLWIEPKTCEHCGHTPECEVVNITYNLAPMWYAVYPDDKQMINIDGLLGEVAEIDLIVARQELKECPEKFIALNPKNGWGTYEGFVACIEKLIELCKKYPDGIWRADR
jgi:hypothetical protein